MRSDVAPRKKPGPKSPLKYLLPKEARYEFTKKHIHKPARGTRTTKVKWIKHKWLGAAKTKTTHRKATLNIILVKGRSCSYLKAFYSTEKHNIDAKKTARR